MLGFPTKNGGCVIWAYRPISIRRTCGEGRSGAAFPADGHFGVSIRGCSTCRDANPHRGLSVPRWSQPKEPDRRFPVISSLVPPRTTPSSGATAKGNQRSWFSRTPPRMSLVKVDTEDTYTHLSWGAGFHADGQRQRLCGIFFRRARVFCSLRNLFAGAGVRIQCGVVHTAVKRPLLF